MKLYSLLRNLLGSRCEWSWNIFYREYLLILPNHSWYCGSSFEHPIDWSVEKQTNNCVKTHLLNECNYLKFLQSLYELFPGEEKEYSLCSQLLMNLLIVIHQKEQVLNRKLLFLFESDSDRASQATFDFPLNHFSKVDWEKITIFPLFLELWRLH